MQDNYVHYYTIAPTYYIVLLDIGKVNYMKVITWCKINAQCKWGISSPGEFWFADQGDAVLVKLTFG